MTWEKFEIGNFVELRQGLAINKSTQKYLSNEVTYLPLLRIGDMKDGNFNVFINDSVPEKFIAKESDIIYTRTGKVGLVFRKQYGVIHNNCFTVSSKDESILIQEFLYYVLQEKSFYEEALSRATGAAQPDLPHGAFSSIEIFLPPIDKQKNIVEILNAYNDLIENNQKQIKLLEEAVQRLYKEWFVDLRFPGYETTPIIDGVPEGWTKKSVENSLEMYIGGGWGKEVPTGNNVIAGKVIRGTDINDIKAGNFKDVPLRYHTKNDISKRNLQKYDIVFELSNGNINNIGRSILIDDFILEKCGENTICASFCKLFRPLDKVHSLILYCEIQDMQNSGRMLPFKKQGSNGINNFAFEEFLNHEFLVPNVEKFIKPIDNIINLISVLQNQVSELIEARDRLLPKLMSGELEA